MRGGGEGGGDAEHDGGACNSRNKFCSALLPMFYIVIYIVIDSCVTEWTLLPEVYYPHEK